MVQEPGSGRCYQGQVEVVAEHRAGVGRTNPGIGGEVRVEPSKYLYTGSPAVVGDQRDQRVASTARSGEVRSVSRSRLSDRTEAQPASMSGTP